MALIQEHLLFYGWCVTHSQSTSCAQMQLAVDTQFVMGWDIFYQYWSLLGVVWVFLEAPSILFSNHVFQPHLTQIRI